MKSKRRRDIEKMRAQRAGKREINEAHIFQAKYQLSTEKPSETLAIKIREIEKLKKNAEHNMSRQRRKETAKKPVRIRSSFWEQVVHDCNRQLEVLNRGKISANKFNF
jgi:hypothetical protein